VKALGATALVWTLVVLGFVLANPFEQADVLACMQFVARTATCTAQQDSVNQALWLDRTLPSIVAIGAGYIGIGIVGFPAVVCSQNIKSPISGWDSGCAAVASRSKPAFRPRPRSREPNGGAEQTGANRHRVEIALLVF
jgi:hypothetical protein